MTSRAAGRRGVRLALLAVVALATVLLSIAAMHASMVRGHESMSRIDHVAATSTAMANTSVVAVSTGSSDHTIGDMNLADCLLLSMVCFLMSVALFLLAVLLSRLRSVLQPRAAARAFGAWLGRLRPPDPPSLLILSISRT